MSGIKKSLIEKIKISDSETITRSRLISKCPSTLFIRFNRFFWKSKESVKAKILKKVTFPLNFEIGEITSSGIPTHFNLQAIVTHSGRTADSGHYICWAKDSDSKWWKFDDDKVNAISEDDIKKLDGGGDWHMAYICMYTYDESNSIQKDF